MLTTSHGIIGYFLFKNKGKKIWVYSILGAILPDTPMILSVIVFYATMFITGDSEVSHDIIHDQFIDKAFSPVMHSIFLWVVIIFITLLIKNKLTKLKIFALGLGGVSHIIIDFITHQGKWTWNHLYPLNFEPVEGIFYYLNPYFIISVHIIWLVLFGPKIYKYLKNKYKKLY